MSRQPVSPTLRRLNALAPYLLALVLLAAGARLASGQTHQAPTSPATLAQVAAGPTTQEETDYVGIAAILAAFVPLVTAFFAGLERVVRAQHGEPARSPDPTEGFMPSGHVRTAEVALAKPLPFKADLPLPPSRVLTTVPADLSGRCPDRHMATWTRCEREINHKGNHSGTNNGFLAVWPQKPPTEPV